MPSPLRCEPPGDELKRAYFKLRAEQRALPASTTCDLVSFGHLNLLDGEILHGAATGGRRTLPQRGIPLNQAARRRVLKTIYRRLVPGRLYLIGHSESLISTTADFELVHLRHDVAYRRPVGAGPGGPGSSESRPP